MTRISSAMAVSLGEDDNVSKTAQAPIDSQINATDSLKYWSSIPTTVDGMLGGYPQVSRIDLQGSKNFIFKVRRTISLSLVKSSLTTKERYTRAVDCGAGIGRITMGLLVNVADVVDMVEPVQKFADVVSSSELKLQGKVGDVFVEGLQSWKGREGVKYDLVWNQWCLGHLTDEQLVTYLTQVSQLLTAVGWICIKENLSTDISGEDIFDEEDSSVTRSEAKWKQLFEKAGMRVVKTELQTGMLKELYPVRMYALRPK